MYIDIDITLINLYLLIIFQTYLVSGGLSNGIDLSSTELLVGTVSAWVFTGELPSPRSGLRGVNIDNKVLMTGRGVGDWYLGSVEYLKKKTNGACKYLGGYYYDGTSIFYDDIWEFDLLSGPWKLVDRMIQARDYHAVSVIDFESELCV